LSIKEFKKFYDKLGVKFDVYSGESFYKDIAPKIIADLEKRKMAVESMKALIIPLEKYNLPPLLIKKSDGTTMYSSRDLAAAIARYNSYKFEKSLYVVGSEQNTYFKQIFKTLELMGMKWAKSCHHVNFGMIYMKEGKMSARKGELVFLEEILEKIIKLSRKFVEKEKLPEKEKDKIAKTVGVSALIYSDLSNDRIKDIKFDWNKILRLEGDSGPYLQYTYARAKSILRKAKSKIKKVDTATLILAEEEKTLITLLNDFPSAIIDSANHFAPHLIANYSLKLADSFNTFYEKCPVIHAKDEKNFRLALTECCSQVLKNSLELLGMSVLERM
jgi:arginyl-tRNA synthetase